MSRRPLLLLLDGHSSHFEPKSLHFAKDNDIIIFCIPPHTTHECQPLDGSFFRSLKADWQQSCHKFYQKNPGKVISKLNFCSEFKPAWHNAIIPSSIINGFKKAGVFPFNRHAVTVVESIGKRDGIVIISMGYIGCCSKMTVRVGDTIVMDVTAKCVKAVN